jgi:hypothetical protein
MQFKMSLDRKAPRNLSKVASAARAELVLEFQSGAYLGHEKTKEGCDGIKADNNR